jgi:hypothetical protein
MFKRPWWKKFCAIPIKKMLTLRAPICPGGSQNSIARKGEPPNTMVDSLPSLVGEVHLTGSFINKDETAVSVEFRCHIFQPECTLRVVDRFIINEEGEITQQEIFLIHVILQIRVGVDPDSHCHFVYG